MAVIVATGLVTNVAMWYVYRKMDEVKAGVVYRRRKARCVLPLSSAPLRLWTLLTSCSCYALCTLSHAHTAHAQSLVVGNLEFAAARLGAPAPRNHTTCMHLHRFLGPTTTTHLQPHRFASPQILAPHYTAPHRTAKPTPRSTSRRPDKRRCSPPRQGTPAPRTAPFPLAPTKPSTQTSSARLTVTSRVSAWTPSRLTLTALLLTRIWKSARARTRSGARGTPWLARLRARLWRGAPSWAGEMHGRGDESRVCPSGVGGPLATCCNCNSRRPWSFFRGALREDNEVGWIGCASASCAAPMVIGC